MDVKNSKIIKKMERAYVNRYIIEYNNFSFPITQKIHRQVVSLPINSVLNKTDLQHICSLINQFND